MLLRTLSILTALALATVLAVQAVPPATAGDLGTPASQAQDPADPMAFQPQHLAAAQITHDLLSNGQYAYAPQPANPDTARQVFEQYIDMLDSQRLLLTQQDVRAMDPGTDALVQAMKGRDLAPARAIYEAFQTRAAERLAYATGLLEDGFDFTRAEAWTQRDEHAPRPATLAESNDLWRQYVKSDWLRLRLAGQPEAAIRQTLSRRYERMAQALQRTDAEQVASTFINAYAAVLDPHTAYMAPIDAQSFNMSMSLSLEGIGAVLQFNDDTVIVRELIKGGPAERSGKLAVGDRILAVGQGVDGSMVDVVGWRLDEVVGLIRGKRGSTVRLSLAAGAEAAPRLVVLVRDQVKMEDQAASGKIIEQDGQRIGVVTLPGFYLDFAAMRAGDEAAKSASNDVARILEGFKAKGVEAVLVDLRGNGGGSLTEAIALTGLFIDVGPVVQVRQADGSVQVEGDARPGATWTGPLGVLVDAHSASASEIFAAAIQDHGRGIIIGETTYGKGTVQTMIDLDDAVGVDNVDLGQVKLTIAQFFRISGTTTQRDGVHPDIVMPMTLDGDQAGEASLANALEPSRIDPVPVEVARPWARLLPDLRADHARRTQDTASLRWWLEDVADYRAERDAHKVSLNEAVRRTERERNQARAAARDAKRRELGLPLPAHRLDDGLNITERSLAEQLALEESQQASGKDDPLLVEAAAILADAVDADAQAMALVVPAPEA